MLRHGQPSMFVRVPSSFSDLVPPSTSENTARLLNGLGAKFLSCGLYMYVYVTLQVSSSNKFIRRDGRVAIDVGIVSKIIVETKTETFSKYNQ